MSRERKVISETAATVETENGAVVRFTTVLQEVQVNDCEFAVELQEFDDKAKFILRAGYQSIAVPVELLPRLVSVMRSKLEEWTAKKAAANGS